MNSATTTSSQVTNANKAPEDTGRISGKDMRQKTLSGLAPSVIAANSRFDQTGLGSRRHLRPRMAGQGPWCKHKTRQAAGQPGPI
jgi:hypothetical protein